MTAVDDLDVVIDQYHRAACRPVILVNDNVKVVYRGHGSSSFQCRTASVLDCRIGSRSSARQPTAPTRLSSEIVPLCASAICRLSARPIPDPLGFVVKNGTNRFEESGSPLPSSSMVISAQSPCVRHATDAPPLVSIDASTAFRTRLMSACSS